MTFNQDEGPVFAIISFGVFKIILFIITTDINAIASTYPIFSVFIFSSLSSVIFPNHTDFTL